MRFERKYIPNYNIRKDLKSFLNTLNIKTLFPSRKITSIYYERKDFSSFLESENGYLNRNKLRIRFYNNDFQNAVIEKKIKNGELGDKNYLKLIDFLKESNTKRINIVDQLFIDIPKKINNLYPNIMIEYYRDYYTSKDKNIRLTYDYNINFKNLNIGGILKSDLNVLEIKYDENYLFNNILLDNLIGQYDLNLSRCSKYCKGVEICF